MRLAITGADGFVGRALCKALQEDDAGLSVRLFDKAFRDQPAFPAVELDLCHPDAAALVGVDADCVIHLAALPGAASEQDPLASRRLNLQFSLSLIEELRGKRLVYASSIAVFGNQFPSTELKSADASPASVYGTHKRMVELAFADAVRRENLSGFALRLPGVVARAEPSAAFGSSFLSEMFVNAFAPGTATIPVSPTASSWLCSAKLCAQNLIHAATSNDSSQPAMVMPAVNARIDELIAELSRHGGQASFEYRQNLDLERAFASHPPIDNTHAYSSGFACDRGVSGLVGNVLADLNSIPFTPARHAQVLTAQG